VALGYVYYVNIYEIQRSISKKKAAGKGGIKTNGGS